MKILHYLDKDFDEGLEKVIRRGATFPRGTRRKVKEIIEDVAKNGDSALFKYCRLFDNASITRKSVEVTNFASIGKRLDKKLLGDLKLAAKRIRSFHKRQVESSWQATDEPGLSFGEIVTPLDRVGIYVPGGQALYPSSVLMNAIPAKLAGVKEVVLVSPVKGKTKLSPVIAAAAEIAGVDRVFQVGGAQAIAALAYGTKTIPKVDKIVGPGNIYVTAAKMQVFGNVDIDMIAGPSEVVIIADKNADPDFIASDLLAQAEHDEMARAILITTSKELPWQVKKELRFQIVNITNRKAAEKALRKNGAIIVVKTLNQAIEISNDIAPEHLEVIVAKPKDALKKIRHAGSIFLGPYSPVASGDYLAGPNHVLPTSGTARFSSPLSVRDFIKHSSWSSMSKNALKKYGASIINMAKKEGLHGHAQSISVRLNER